MPFKLLLLSVLLLNTLLLSPALANNGNGNGNAGNGTGNGNGNNGNGNGNGGPNPTPGLDPAAFTGLATAGYVGFQILKARKNKP